MPLPRVPTMTERPRRPILSLKQPLARPLPPLPKPPAEPTWKCKPCGAPFAPQTEGDERDAVRCPKCNARVGTVGDFRADPPRADKVRARPIAR